MGTENILKYGLAQNAKVLVASTSEIYGDPLEHLEVKLTMEMNPSDLEGFMTKLKDTLKL